MGVDRAAGSQVTGRMAEFQGQWPEWLPLFLIRLNYLVSYSSNEELQKKLMSYLSILLVVCDKLVIRNVSAQRFSFQQTTWARGTGPFGMNEPMWMNIHSNCWGKSTQSHHSKSRAGLWDSDSWPWVSGPSVLLVGVCEQPSCIGKSPRFGR